MQKRLPKLRRTPHLLRPRRITARTVAIVRKVAEYRFILVFLLFALVGGNLKVNHRHTQWLFHEGFLNRFRFGLNEPFVYYIDSSRALDMLSELGGMAHSALPWKEIKTNREARYCDFNKPGKAQEAVGRLPFLSHELMISRLHCALELGCQASNGQVELADWQQGRSKLLDRVLVPKITRSGDEWFERDESEWLPCEPDAFFTLRFPYRSDGEREVHFFYEADRKTTSSPRFSRKLRSHFHYVVRQKRHKEKYDVRRIRAVLIETLDEHWREHLMQAARHPMVSGHRPSSLFWFANCEVIGQGSRPAFLSDPGVIFRSIWRTVDGEAQSLLD